MSTKFANRMFFKNFCALHALSLLAILHFVNSADVHADVHAEVHSMKAFIVPIKPELFNWTFSDSGSKEQFSYRPSLLGSPDLPSWVLYMYSKTYHNGYVYGAPPPNQASLTLEIVGLNHEDYDTRRRIVHLRILPRKEPARHQVQLKVDNLNVDDMFDPRHLERLLDIFRSELWREAGQDLHVTFVDTATRHGARLPLHPDEKEGVVIFLGSAANLSDSLHHLQEEVRPLYKLRNKVPSCPRDFKRTTVDRLFRQQNFEIDWCAFRLSSEGAHRHQGHRHHETEEQSSLRDQDASVWQRPTRSQVPVRSYVNEFLLSILVPMLIMILLVVMLSLVLCFHHEGMRDGASEYFDSIFDIFEDMWGNKRVQETPAVQMVKYAAVQRATSTLRSLSAQRDPPPPATPRPSSERDTSLRPLPPPYGVRGNAANVDF